MTISQLVSIVALTATMISVFVGENAKVSHTLTII